MAEFAGVVVGAIILGIVFMAGGWMYDRLTGSIAARLHASWRWVALPITAVLCGGAFAALRPLIVDQPRTPMWFVLGATGVALLFASATAFGWTMIEAGRRIVALSYREPHVHIPRPQVPMGPERPVDSDDHDLQLDSALPEHVSKEELGDPN